MRRSIDWGILERLSLVLATRFLASSKANGMEVAHD